MKKLLTLFTLLLCVCSGAWGDDYHYVNTSTWELTPNFRSALTVDNNSRTIDGNTYNKTRKFGSTKTALGNPTDIGTNYVVYEVKTTSTSFDIYVYSTQTSEKKLFVSEIAEGAESATTTELTVPKNTGTKLTYNVKGSTNNTIYFFVNDTKILIGDIVAKETGTTLPTGGKAGFSMSFNKGRSAIKSATATSIESMEFCLSSNYGALNSTVAPVKTNGTHYIKFSVDKPMILNLTTSSATNYNVSTTKGSDDNQVTPTKDVAKANKLTAAGTYYINPQGSNVNVTNIAFSAAPQISYNANGGSGTMSTTYFTVADNGFTAPDGQVFDGWKDGESNDYAVGAEVEADVTLYAQWRTPAVKHHVTYDLNGGTGTTPTETDKEEGDKFTLHDGVTDITAPDGKKFVAWNDGTKNYDGGALYTMPGDDVTLTAQWISSYTVEFDLQGHGSAIDAQEVAEGGKAVEPTAPTADGWVFGGWYEESTCENEFDFNTTINAEKTLYAKWTEDVRASVFSLSFVNTSDYKMSEGDNNDLTESEVSVTGGSASIHFWNNKTDITVLETSSKKIYYSTGKMNLKLVLNTPLKVGDVISFAGGTGNQIAITDTDESPNDSPNKEVTTSYSYTVKADDHLVGKSTIYVGREGSSSTRHGAITITSAAANVTVSNLGIEGEKDYATMYYGTVAMAVPAGVKAKTYKVVDGKLTVSRTYENGGIYDVIPAGEAVVLEADVDANTPYMFSVSSTTTEPDGENLLRGTDVAQTINTAGYKYYKLAKNNAGTKVGFYYAVEDGVSITNGAHKAYLAVPEGDEAKTFFVLGEDDETSSETTAISGVEIEIANGATLYNLAGQKVGKDYKGIIVVNGKKYVRK